MKDKFKYIEKSKRKKIILLSDDFRTPSGIGTMSREIILNTAHHFNWVNLGASPNHPDKGRVLDMGKVIKEESGVEDPYVRIYPYASYGDSKVLRELIKIENPDALLIFTDPRYWIWLFEIEREIRQNIPIIYLNIWDEYPAPMYNKPYYESVDALLAISKQTYNINKIVLGDKAKDKVIKYVPHGVNADRFYPIREGHSDFEDLQKFKKAVNQGNDIEFTVFFNSRNIKRKNVSDTILAYKRFCDYIGKDLARKCNFILHTSPVDQHGTDLYAVRDTLCDPDYVKVIFSKDKITTQQLNMFYNMADVTVLASSNEGWGLSLTESLMAGTMIIANTTGGMQDQMRFSINGKWVDFTPEFPSNHNGTITVHSEWAIPVYPVSVSLAGSPLTPYIYDSKPSIVDIADAMVLAYELGKEERDKRGMLGREWLTGNEARMSSEGMAQNIIEGIEETFEKFTPRTPFDFYKVEIQTKETVPHALEY